MADTTHFAKPGAILQEAGVTANMIVADLGCGSGYISFAAANLVKPEGKVYAVDIRKEILGHIESKKKIFGERGVETIHADLTVPGSTGIADDEVDASILATIVFQIPNVDALMEEAKRITRPGGLVLIIDWKKMRSSFGPSEAERIPEDEMKKIVSRHGFEFIRDVATDPFHYGFVCKNL